MDGDRLVSRCQFCERLFEHGSTLFKDDPILRACPSCRREARENTEKMLEPRAAPGAARVAGNARAEPGREVVK